MLEEELCLDANVFVAALSRKEEKHKICLEILKKVQEDQIPLYEPAIVIYEVTSALYKKIATGDITLTEGEDLIDCFFKLPLLLQWKPQLMKKTNELALQMNLRQMYDGSYLALALVREIPFITLDEEFIKKGRKIFKKILTPADLFRD